MIEIIFFINKNQVFNRNCTQIYASSTLCIPIYSNISESIELFFIYSNIRITQNHDQSLQIIKNYPMLSDPFESGQPLRRFLYLSHKNILKELMYNLVTWFD